MKRVVFEDGRGYVLVEDTSASRMDRGDPLWIDGLVFDTPTLYIERIEEA